jgi:hypothetical protein
LMIGIPDEPDGVSALRSGANWAGTLVVNSANLAVEPWEMVGLDPSGDVVVAFANAGTGRGKSFSQWFDAADEKKLAGHIINRDSVDIAQFLQSLGAEEQRTAGTAFSMVQFIPGQNGIDVGSITISVTEVPEPGSMVAMAIVGAVAMVGRRRRRH